MTYCATCGRPIGPSSVFPGAWLCQDCEAAHVAQITVVPDAPAEDDHQA